MKQILAVFKKPDYSDEEDGKEVGRLVGEMQDLGGPPQEIMGDLPEGFVSQVERCLSSPYADPQSSLGPWSPRRRRRRWMYNHVAIDAIHLISPSSPVSDPAVPCDSCGEIAKLMTKIYYTDLFPGSLSSTLYNRLGALMSKDPVPLELGTPMTILAAGEDRSSKSPCKTASDRN